MGSRRSVQGRTSGARRRRTLLHGHPAAERHRQPAHGPRAQQHLAGHSLPLPADERIRRALAAGHGSRRHCDPDGGRAPARRGAGARPARHGPRGVSRAGLAVEGGVGRGDRRAAQAPGRVLRLEPRAVHPRRGPVARGRQGVRPTLSRRARLQGQAPRQLGPEVPDRDLRPRSFAGRVQGRVQMVARSPASR